MWQVFVRDEAGVPVKGSIKVATQREAFDLGMKKYGVGRFDIMEVESSIVSGYRPPSSRL